MRRNLAFFIGATACLIFVLGTTARAADPTGNWTWSVPGRDGGPAREVTAKLKLEGDKLTGSVAGRQSDTAIADGKLTGEDISFTVTREFNGMKIVSKYTGKFSGDSIKGKIATERDGQNTSANWDAKREAAKPAEAAPKPATP